MKTGWIKTYRKLMDHWIWKYREPYDHRSAWQYILLEAYFCDDTVAHKGEIIHVKRGQFPTSIRDLAERWMWSKGKVQRFLNDLEAERMIELKRTKNGTLLTVVNYGFYQGCEDSDGTLIGTVTGTLTGHSRDTDGYTDGTPTGHNIRNKEYKEDKELKKERNKEEEKKEGTNVPKKKEPVVYYPDDEKLNQAFMEFLKMRKTIKKPLETKTGITRAMNKLLKLSGGDNNLAIRILDQSTYHCWQDLYELKAESQGKKSTNIFDVWRDA